MDKWAERWANGQMDITGNYGLVWLYLVSSGRGGELNHAAKMQAQQNYWPCDYTIKT